MADRHVVLPKTIRQPRRMASEVQNMCQWDDARKASKIPMFLEGVAYGS